MAVGLVAVPLLAIAVYVGWAYNKAGVLAPGTLYDTELIAADSSNRNKIFVSNFNESATPQSMLEAATAYCSPLTANPANLETCTILMSHNSDTLSLLNNSGADIGEVWNTVMAEWDKGSIVGIYLRDLDVDSTKDRPDDNFVVDCGVYANVEKSRIVSCKSASRSERMRSWYRKSEDALPEAAADAAADTARADAIAAVDNAARAALDAADNVEMPTEEAVPSYSAAQEAVGFGAYVIADANLRNRPTSGSSNLSRVPRGRRLPGEWVTGEDGVSRWLRLADGTGFVSSVNLSSTAPPRLSTNLGEYAFRPSQDLQLHAQPSEMSSVVDTVPPGTLLILTGITANGFAEAKGRRGGVGYFESSGYDFGRR